MTTYEIDGHDFSTLEGFFDEIGHVVIPGAEWGHNLDAFDDVLRGGFGTPDDGFVLRWKNHELSRQRLGYPETVRLLEQRLRRCHPTNREEVQRELDLAREDRGATVFDWLVEILADHGPGGDEAEDNVKLELA
jgi:RNAse (barnase) inhibitor barstar